MATRLAVPSLSSQSNVNSVLCPSPPPPVAEATWVAQHIRVGVLAVVALRARSVAAGLLDRREAHDAHGGERLTGSGASASGNRGCARTSRACGVMCARWNDGADGGLLAGVQGRLGRSVEGTCLSSRGSLVRAADGSLGEPLARRLPGATREAHSSPPSTLCAPPASGGVRRSVATPAPAGTEAAPAGT